MVVFQRMEDGKPTCIVERAGKIVSRQPDDPWGSLCLYVLLGLLRACYRAFGSLKEYPAPPAYKFLSKFNVKELVDKFDFVEFEEEILPRLEGKSNFNKVVANWQLIKENDMMNGEPADLYEVYDWIVRLRLLMRAEKGSGAPSLPADIKTDVEQMGNIKDIKFALITNEAFVPAFKTVHAEGAIVCRGEDKIFVTNPLSCQTNFFGLQYATIPELEAEAFKEPQEETLYDEQQPIESTSDLVSKVVTLLGRPRQKMSSDDNEFLDHGGHPELLDGSRGGLGKSALRGMRNVVGEGEIGGCIQRLAGYLSDKLPGAPIEQVTDFAAGRIAAMQGDYRPSRQLRPDGKADWILVFKNVNNRKPQYK